MLKTEVIECIEREIIHWNMEQDNAISMVKALLNLKGRVLKGNERIDGRLLEKFHTLVSNVSILS